MRYSPHEIDFEDTAEIDFSSNSIGNWRFLAFGKGLYPEEYDTIQKEALLHTESTAVFSFTNPLKNVILLTLSLEENGASEGIFSLKYNASKKIQLKPGQRVSVTVSYVPMEIREYCCNVVLKLNDNLSWTFPVRVITEASVPQKELTF